MFDDFPIDTIETETATDVDTAANPEYEAVVPFTNAQMIRFFNDQVLELVGMFKERTLRSDDNQFKFHFAKAVYGRQQRHGYERNSSAGDYLTRMTFLFFESCSWSIGGLADGIGLLSEDEYPLPVLNLVHSVLKEFVPVDNDERDARAICISKLEPHQRANRQWEPVDDEVILRASRFEFITTPRSTFDLAYGDIISAERYREILAAAVSILTHYVPNRASSVECIELAQFSNINVHGSSGSGYASIRLLDVKNSQNGNKHYYIRALTLPMVTVISLYVELVRPRFTLAPELFLNYDGERLSSSQLRELLKTDSMRRSPEIPYISGNLRRKLWDTVLLEQKGFVNLKGAAEHSEAVARRHYTSDSVKNAFNALLTFAKGMDEKRGGIPVDSFSHKLFREFIDGNR